MLFQFHMVRLKGARPTEQLRAHLFQFHMVRLKDSIMGWLSSLISFQFHMVRLKVLQNVLNAIVDSDFNSTWYD